MYISVEDEFMVDEPPSKSPPPSKAAPSGLSGDRWFDFKIMFLMATFYSAIVGSERVFLSMQFTFGLCGPLHLDPSEAVITDKVYTGGFMVGR